ncbi:MAG TPA: alkaline phosphatase family protein [Thermoanaerobaculia bacterium]|nr:alkaline phosphatase family protein [Thermoanaerobaculia bacterium]
MKPGVVTSLLLMGCGISAAQAQIQSFSHVVVIIQENRTPDNLFQGLCAPPFGSASSCSTAPTASQYNIQTKDWRDKTSRHGIIQPTTVPLANKYDLDHSHAAFVTMCDPSAGACKMDGATGVHCAGVCPRKPQFRYVANTKGDLNPYLRLATQYGWANYMFQTNQGPSFPAHQFLFGATSAPSAADDAAGIFASENLEGTGGVGGLNKIAGCTATGTTTVRLIAPDGTESQKIYPCFEHQTMADLFPRNVTWRFYAPGPGTIWTAPNAIQHLCQSTGPGGTCTGPEWQQNVDLVSADVLKDIADCNLRSVSWVVPTCQNSDHAKCNDGGGPSWVASIVNAIGKSSACDNGTGYWENTAIFVTWDDWGGWYDHEPPTILPQPEGDYQYGFRVPLLVVSAYTPPAYVNNRRHDFGSILRFIEQNFGIHEGALNFADLRSATDLTAFFDLTATPRTFVSIAAPKDAKFFLTDKRPQMDPDDD